MVSNNHYQRASQNLNLVYGRSATSSSRLGSWGHINTFGAGRQFVFIPVLFLLYVDLIVFFVALEMRRGPTYHLDYSTLAAPETPELKAQGSTIGIHPYHHHLSSQSKSTRHGILGVRQLQAAPG